MHRAGRCIEVVIEVGSMLIGSTEQTNSCALMLHVSLCMYVHRSTLVESQICSGVLEGFAGTFRFPANFGSVFLEVSARPDDFAGPAG